VPCYLILGILVTGLEMMDVNGQLNLELEFFRKNALDMPLNLRVLQMMVAQVPDRDLPFGESLHCLCQGWILPSKLKSKFIISNPDNTAPHIIVLRL
jgi:hypothetical protein